MPRTCLACSSSEREAIDKALVAGEPLRNIAKRVSLSPAGLLRHKSHISQNIVKAADSDEGNQYSGLIVISIPGWRDQSSERSDAGFCIL
jgi:hypothetical protein